MQKRFVSIWFPYLHTDWFSLRKPELDEKALVLASPDHGRMIITSANLRAQQQGVNKGILVADARAIIPALEVMDDLPDLSERLLRKLAAWCICFSPVAGIVLPDGIMLDVTGCAHLWGGEEPYLTQICKRLTKRGYKVKAAMADTVGAAWAIARFGKETIIGPGSQKTALLHLPPVSLRIDDLTIDRLQKLGLKEIKDFLEMPRSALRRRFGPAILQRLDQALGAEEETIEPVQPIEPYQERLPCLEPIVTAKGIEIALERLLETLCQRLLQEEKGLRTACLKCFRVDGRVVSVAIGTSKPSHHAKHLFKLFAIKLPTLEPALGIELFLLEAGGVEDHTATQERIWNSSGGLLDTGLAELIDRLAAKIGPNAIQRYVPDEHHWPERSVKKADSLAQKLTAPWKQGRPRPTLLLSKPEPLEVTAPIPDYPPMLFRCKGKLHKIIKADGPERIEQEWWLKEGQHRDYYYVEDEEGRRYWIFRSGHYSAEKNYQWFLHGYFA